MKCPRCEYLGFDTSDRCKNCGYDFSLLRAPDTIPDLDLRAEDGMSDAPEAWLDYLRDHAGPAPQDGVMVTVADELDVAADESEIDADEQEGDAVEPEVRLKADTTYEVHAPTTSTEAPPLPLFMSALEGDDEPLIKVPARPRAPLAVRRTPEIPRLRNIAKAVQMEPEPAFEFAENPAPAPPASEMRSPRLRATPAKPVTLLSSGPGLRLLAAAIDHVILLAIDAAVLYFTLKMAALTFADWRVVPVAPLLVFLLLVKFAYFSAFTAVGGQTIGKMGAGIRVIADDGTLIDASRALRRSLAGAVSFLTLGAAFAPALFGADGRALHDRVAHTRVVALQ